MNSGFGEERQATFDVPSSVVATTEGARVQQAKLKVGPGGRVLIPAALRDQLGLCEGDAVMATVENGELRLMSLKESVRRAQQLVRAKLPVGKSLADELLQDRRREVEQERKRG